MCDPQPNDDNLINFIAATVESMRDQMLTKSDLEPVREEIAYVGGQVEALRSQMTTKSDIARLEAKIEVETTAIRGDIEQVHLRLDSIERALNARLAQIETEVSRLRAVVYLLVKDKPEMLRLLGQPPASDEGRL